MGEFNLIEKENEIKVKIKELSIKHEEGINYINKLETELMMLNGELRLVKEINAISLDDKVEDDA